MKNDKYEVVIGLEVHAQLLTKSKIFCGDSAAFGGAPNTHISPVTLAHPGSLPKMNKKAIEYAVKLGIALHCEIEQHNYFARKNYFYPDLPKGYQISQHTTPICKNGFVKIKVGDTERSIRLNRIHMEEDAGKSLHDVDEHYTAIDLNRAGVALLEIVSEPDLHSSEEAFAYVTELRRLVRWIDICDGNMEEGSMRCDANISIRLKGETKLGTRVEVKNLNSIRNVKRAIDIEVDRLIDIVESGNAVVQETRSFDADNNTTFSLRSKEDADDYRYFADPDLTPFNITDEFLQTIKAELPALPEELETKYRDVFLLAPYDAQVICSDKSLVNYFEAIIKHTSNYKAAVNWLMGPVKSYLNENSIELDAFPLPADKIAELIQLVDDGKVNFSIASTKIFAALLQSPDKKALQIATELNLLQESDSGSIEAWVDEVIGKMPDKVVEYKKGKKGLIGMFAGEVKKLSKGKADMNLVNKLLAEKLNG
ncbi:Asp-tRNA(Asn)/Glu-tRNA(Gln) amidotransferase subunit GatB [Ferruginibacter lapsinanis]|uniref:Asp-tRNA(Asn)/Glu-tRNA(Gln) amidotransferase subunit GatB n=1 Tax=Ferruginibacter lapsinanis TaxID=563172 RepID=UPI001E4A6E95|nr:Asp-tRNA(Asn)/Glu-tRNA(Gln) amidotransferase subunit GatB [Ferruginibacter lapsinanis]UEG50962.1 Asp-tRNA(Asn)/Glu-tRNA(Gln) amidotransferase subunit GatB [Ferruginibacter lapsinanis]